jgi:hypothetical protein
MQYRHTPKPLHEEHLEDLWTSAAFVHTAKDLKKQAGHFLPPLAAHVTRCALHYFAQPIVRSDGARDGRLAYAKNHLGFGRRLVPEQRITEWYTTPSGREKSLFLGLLCWLSKPHPEIESFRTIDRVHQSKQYGIEDPYKLAALFIWYIHCRERGIPRGPLPESYR